MKKEWKDKEIKFLIAHYSTASKDFLMNNLDRSWSSIQNRATRKHKLVRNKGANYANITYFDNWSAESSYIFGFIIADGCIIDRSKSTGDKVLSIAVGKSDYNHLKNIRDLISPNKNIWNCEKKIGNNKYIAYYLRIGSKYMCNNLIKMGVVHRKSLILDFPYVPERYLHHFVRGYFDGDGSFGIYKNNARVSFASGSIKFLETLNKKIHDNCDISIKNVIYGKSAGAYYLNYHTCEALKVCKWMYQDNTICLDRKYEKYRKALK